VSPTSQVLPRRVRTHLHRHRLPSGASPSDPLESSRQRCVAQSLPARSVAGIVESRFLSSDSPKALERSSESPLGARSLVARGSRSTVFGLFSSQARAFPERPALRDGRVSLSHGQLLERVCKLAAAMHHLGVRRGDRL